MRFSLISTRDQPSECRVHRRFARPHKPGAIIGLYLVLYPSVRFLVEFLRSHDAANPHLGPLVLEQWIALGLMALGVYLMRGVELAPSPAARPSARSRR